MEEENDEEHEVEKIFSEILVTELSVNKYYLCIVACIMVEEDDQRNGLNLDEVAVQSLLTSFSEVNLRQVCWRTVDSVKQVGILYGLMCLLGCSFASKVREAAREVLRRVLLFDMRERYMPVYNLIKSFGEAQIEFQNAINGWYEWEVPLKLDALVEGINILFTLTEEQEVGIVEASYKVISYFVVYNEIECVPLLSYTIDKLSPLFSKQQHQGCDHIWQWMQNIVQHLNTCKEDCDTEIMLTQESLTTEFNHTLELELVCAFLLRLSLLGTRHSVEVNSVILYIEKSNRGARLWGARAPLMNRLLLILEEHQKVQAKEAILKCIFHVSQNMVDMGGAFLQDPEGVLRKMAEYFVNGLGILYRVK